MAPSESSTKKHYFLVSGEVEYLPQGAKAPLRQKVNGVHIGKTSSINAKNLGEIQVMLQMHFHTKNSRVATSAPEITDVVIFSVSYLGEFTAEEFRAGAPK